MGQELGVDVQLADAAGDELGELAAEVQDDHRVRLAGRGAARDTGTGPILGRALRAGRLEGGLEVGLDLGVVGSQDPVAGVGGLTVDGLAPVGLGRRRRLVARFRALGVCQLPPPRCAAPSKDSGPGSRRSGPAPPQRLSATDRPRYVPLTERTSSAFRR